MYEVAQPLVARGGRRRRGAGRHVQRALAQEGARQRRHAPQVVQHHEHLHQRAVRVEQRHLHRARRRHAVAARAQVDVALSSGKLN